MDGLIVDRDGNAGLYDAARRPVASARHAVPAEDGSPGRAQPAPWPPLPVTCDTPEFTCLCPLTGQPDFATVRISYVPDQSLVELKALKLYLWSFRDERGFHEDMTNRILDARWRPSPPAG